MKKLLIIFMLFATKAMCQNEDVRVNLLHIPVLKRDDKIISVPESLQTIQTKLTHSFKIGDIQMDDDIAKDYFKHCLSIRDTIEARGFYNCQGNLGGKHCYFASTQNQSDFNKDLELKAIKIFNKNNRPYYIVNRIPSELDFMQWYLKR
jgi:hypothetical protein